MEFKLDLMQMMSFNTALELVLCTQNVCTFGSDYKNQNQNHFSIFGMWAFYISIFSATAEKKVSIKSRCGWSLAALARITFTKSAQKSKEDNYYIKMTYKNFVSIFFRLHSLVQWMHFKYYFHLNQLIDSNVCWQQQQEILQISFFSFWKKRWLNVTVLSLW